MTSPQFRKGALALLGTFQIRRAAIGKHDADFEFTSGLRVNVFFAHRREFTKTIAPAWVHFGLNAIGEEAARKLSLETRCYCWWKWNIHCSGRPAEQRASVFDVLQRRIQRCVEHGVIFPAGAASGASPDVSGAQSVHDTRHGGENL